MARELTKRFEEVTRGSPKTVGEDYGKRAEGVLGEIVLCIRLAHESISEEKLDEALRSAMQQMRLKEAAQYGSHN